MPSRTVRCTRSRSRSYDAGARPRDARRCTARRGTYVRALVRDLGELAGCGAYCDELRREASGPLEVAHAASLGALENNPTGGLWALSPAAALMHLPARELEASPSRRPCATDARSPRAGRGRARRAASPMAGSSASPSRSTTARPEGRPGAQRVRIVRDPAAPSSEPGARRAVALGTFDGVHMGHRALIAEVVGASARARRARERRDLRPDAARGAATERRPAAALDARASERR